VRGVWGAPMAWVEGGCRGGGWKAGAGRGGLRRVQGEVPKAAACGQVLGAKGCRNRGGGAKHACSVQGQGCECQCLV